MRIGIVGAGIAVTAENTRGFAEFVNCTQREVVDVGFGFLITCVFITVAVLHTVLSNNSCFAEFALVTDESCFWFRIISTFGFYINFNCCTA